MVITLQNLPREIEEALQRMSLEQGKPLDRVTADVLAHALGTDRNSISVPKLLESDRALDEQHRNASLGDQARRDLSLIVGTWVEDPDFEAALEQQRRIDSELWQ